MVNQLKCSSAFLVILFFIGCSSAENLNSDSQIEMTEHNVDSWLNLMPGISPDTFHLKGNFTLKNNGTSEVDSIDLTKITAYADSHEIYTFKPEFKSESSEAKYSLQPGASKGFSFGTGQGLKVNDMLMKYKRIDIKLELITSHGKQYFEIFNIKVVRAY